jgi:hypothetical protein
MSTPTTPHYLEPMVELIRQSRDRLKAGRVYEMQVAHDDWCLIFKGQVCNCNPTTTLIDRNPDPERN